MKAQFVKVFLVIPALNSVNFWPFICTKEGNFVKYVKYWFDLTTAKKDYSVCKNCSGIFGKSNSQFRMLAILIDFTVV